MRAGTVLGLGVVLSLGVAAEACSSSTSDVKASGDASTEASATGGATGKGGSTSTGGTTSKGTGGTKTGPKCDQSSCQAKIGGILQNLGAAAPPDGGTSPVTPCCLSATACGVDLSAIAALVNTIPSGCVDPTTLADAGLNLSGVSYPITSNGFVETPDGGAPIELDPACPGILVSNPLVPIRLPGCCLPTGKCGGSTHKLPSLVKAPLGCESNDTVSTFTKSLLGGVLTVAADPNKSCTYVTVETKHDASVGTGGASGTGGAGGTGGGPSDSGKG